MPEEAVETAVVVGEDGALLLVRRPDEGLLGGMWEPPGEHRPPAVQALIDDADPGAEMEPVVHVFSHKRVTYYPRIHHVARASLRAGGGTAWATGERLPEFALPVAQARIARRALRMLAAGAPVAPPAGG